MSLLLVPAWVLKRMGRSPWLAGLGLGLLALCPLLVQLTPLEGVPVEGLAQGLAQAWSVPVGVLGALWAMTLLTGGREFVRLLPLEHRLVAEGLSVTAACAMMQLPLWIGASFAGSWTPASWEGLLQVLCLDLHLGAMACLILRLELDQIVGALFLLFAAWLLPALLPTGMLRDLLHPWLDPAWSFDEARSGVSILWCTLPIASWALFAWCRGRWMELPR